MRQRREQFNRVTVLRSGHLRPVLLGELGPLGGGLSALGNLDGLCTRRQVGKPHIVPIARSELALGDASRRPANRSDTNPLTFGPGTAQPHHANRHRFSPPEDHVENRSHRRAPTGCAASAELNLSDWLERCYSKPRRSSDMKYAEVCPMSGSP